jgi:hypothetical protein
MAPPLLWLSVMDRINHMDNTLPVTAEVGDEGGSFAEQTRAPGERVARETIEWAGLQEDQNVRNVLRYPTEHPSEEREPSGRAWKKGLVGVAAGTAALIGVSKLRRREG